jgi:hypothetical protein
VLASQAAGDLSRQARVLPVASTTNQSRRTSAGFAENVFISLFPLGIFLSLSRKPARRLKGAKF